MKGISKHFTIKQISVSLFALLLAALFKFIILPVILDYISIDLTEIPQYIISGSLVIMIRLAVKGYLEVIISEHFPQYMTMNPGDPNPSFPPQAGPSQAGPSQAGPSQAGPSQVASFGRD